MKCDVSVYITCKAKTTKLCAIFHSYDEKVVIFLSSTCFLWQSGVEFSRLERNLHLSRFMLQLCVTIYNVVWKT